MRFFQLFTNCIIYSCLANSFKQSGDFKHKNYSYSMFSYVQQFLISEFDVSSQWDCHVSKNLLSSKTVPSLTWDSNFWSKDSPSPIVLPDTNFKSEVASSNDPVPGQNDWGV